MITAEKDMSFVYITKCSDNSYYTGVTNNIEKRLWEHNSDMVRGYTQNRRPVALVYFQEFNYIHDAIAFEKQLKGWGRSKKEALINGDIKSLKQLSKSHKSHPSSGSG